MSRMFVVGNLVHDPSVKFTNNGTAICDFTIADNYKRNKDADDEVSYFDVVLFGTLAENFASSCHKGDRVFAEGRAKQERWETEDGTKRSKVKLIADSAGVELRFHVASISKGPSHGERKPDSGRASDDDDFF